MALEQKPQPVSEKCNIFHRYLLWFVEQWFYYSLLRACKLYTDDHCQTATKNVLPFIRNSELCICYKILFWPAIFQRFLPSSALDPVLRASHIAQEPTVSFPRPSFLPPCTPPALYDPANPNRFSNYTYISICVQGFNKFLKFFWSKFQPAGCSWLVLNFWANLCLGVLIKFVLIKKSV